MARPRATRPSAHPAPARRRPGKRCVWAEGSALMRVYHDREWGVPLHNDRRLFEFLILEGMQAGLSWEIILRKRPQFRKAFDRFDPARGARYTPRPPRRPPDASRVARNPLEIPPAS